jgi:hypothetical protein
VFRASWPLKPPKSLLKFQLWREYIPRTLASRDLTRFGTYDSILKHQKIDQPIKKQPVDELHGLSAPFFLYQLFDLIACFLKHILNRFQSKKT